MLQMPFPTIPSLFFVFFLAEAGCLQRSALFDFTYIKHQLSILASGHLCPTETMIYQVEKHLTKVFFEVTSLVVQEILK